jgi:hypothetical protein
MKMNIAWVFLSLCYTSAFAQRILLQTDMRHQPQMHKAAAPTPRVAAGSSSGSFGQAYQHLIETGESDVHIYYSFNSPVPESPCSNGVTVEHMADCSTTPAGCLHMAISAPTNGYVALAYAGPQGKMFPADAVIATAAVNSYHIQRFGIASKDITTGWAVGMGYVQQQGVKTLCFSRRLQSDEAKVVKTVVLDARESTSQDESAYTIHYSDIHSSAHTQQQVHDVSCSGQHSWQHACDTCNSLSHFQAAEMRIGAGPNFAYLTLSDVSACLH